MSNCCDSQTADRVPEFLCPVSRTKGARVSLETIKALLRDEPRRRVRVMSHWFCPDGTCDVVYFDESGQYFTRMDVNVPVWQKEPAGRRMICYCFGENEEDIGRELERLGRSAAVDRVRQHVQAGRCACETRNPRGACCLGELTMAVRSLAAALRDESGHPQ